MHNPTIVCVDDESNVLLTLRNQLMRHFPNCTIELAESGTEALDCIDQVLSSGAEIPLVIADQIMPGMKGDALLIELHTRYPQILMVMLTGQARAEDVGNVVNRGSLYRFIAKPWDEMDLNLTVTEALRRYEQEQQLSQNQRDLEQANRELEAYSQTLEHRVEERTAELITAQERIIAQEKLAALGTLTAGIAHELRNPLNFVKNYAEGSIELTQDLLDILQPVIQSQEPKASVLIESLIADLQENAATICRHSQRAAQIITSMMQHARTDTEQNSPLQPTPLHDLLNEAVKLAYQGKRVQDSHFNLIVHTDYAFDVDVIQAIPSNLMRAFINLIDNACDAMRFKQHELHTQSTQPAAAYRPTLEVSTRLGEERVEICIHDNGCGISPQILAKVLDPFFTTKPPGAGTGLGLSIAHDIIVKQHQGTLAIDTKFGEFTEILVALPYSQRTLS
ncbi:histidine kinase [Tumidithrix helvetica PCC 7403]|uniref:hybrid sensor histidine kinase/response regulator n=1 Tax=Tumidithrix helvetica TaxID=3457545 RepID=UPI003CAF0B0F